MSQANDITERLIEEGTKARSYFQIWWVLNNRAYPDYASTMQHWEYSDFFYATSPGYFTLFVLALSKMFDRDPRSAGFQSLRTALEQEGKPEVAAQIEAALTPLRPKVKRIMEIRSQSVVHNSFGLSRDDIYKANGITIDEIRDLVDATCQCISRVAAALDIQGHALASERTANATLRMLAGLKASLQHTRD
ncbi:AbiU2 domain-containing protein [Achromobacter xylosoxidans]|nr:hypothetical protein [Achromobacter xylosoxidans]